MRLTRQKYATLTLIVVLALAACGPTAPVEPTLDVNGIHTAAAETVTSVPPTEEPREVVVSEDSVSRTRPFLIVLRSNVGRRGMLTSPYSIVMFAVVR